jgi:hypothetical protein
MPGHRAVRTGGSSWFNPWRQTKKFRKMSPKKTTSTSRFRIHSPSEDDLASSRKATSNGVTAAVKSSATAVTSDRANTGSVVAVGKGEAANQEGGAGCGAEHGVLQLT